jgi:hypothetical protein
VTTFVGVLSIIVSTISAYCISKSGKEDAKKFADAAQKAANEAERNRQITQRAELIPHFVSVKKMLKAFDEKRQLRVGELRAMQDSLSHLLQHLINLIF